MCAVESSRRILGGIPVVELAGSPETIGRAHGRLLRGEVRRSYFELIESRALPGLAMELVGEDPKKIKDFADWCRRQALRYEDRIPDAYAVEMRALARETDLDRGQILLAQTLLDVVELAGMTHSGPFFHACTQAAFLPEATGGPVLVARNLDWPSFGLAHELGVLFHVLPDDGIPFWSLGFAGSLGTLTAVNREGLCVTEESLTVTTDVSDEGIPTFLLHRLLAERENTVAGAVERLCRAPRNNGYHTLIVSGRERDARTVLHSARRYAVRGPRAGVCWGVETDRQAARYEGGVMPPEEVPLTDETSDFRYLRMKQLLERDGPPVTVEKLKTWLGDDIHPETGRPDTTLHCLANETTLQSLAADLTRMEIQAAMGVIPAPRGGWVSVDAR